MNITTKLFEGHSIRVLPVSQAQDTIWFVASDVSAALGYDAPHRALRHVDADDTASAALQTPGGMQTVTLISESGVYAMIFGSRRPEAKAFKVGVRRLAAFPEAAHGHGDQFGRVIGGVLQLL